MNLIRVSFLFLFVFIATVLHAQHIRLFGNINDTAAKKELPNVLLMAIKFNDSTLVNYTRTDTKGFFKPIKVPLDTYIVILSHPSFNEKTYLIVPNKNDTVFNFKNVVLPPKSIELKEVEIFAFKEKTYYKGDTLMFTADSFKTSANATVEDLLKKLPGVQVDKAGKITIQGKQVDQVLVDGDEFFGTDPTIATRNLNATAIENIQVYDKKNESSEDGKNETLKVVNLKLKDDAKKGYFGKVSGATDFTKFYENELLFNKFKGNRKISVFGLTANTPKQSFDWNEIDKYGLSGENSWEYNEDANNWTSTNEQRTGVPSTIKAGLYFNDKIGKKTKVNTDYTFNQNSLQAAKEVNTQFFLEDTSYTNTQNNKSNYTNQNHALNFRFIQKMDSLTELTVFPKIKYNTIQSSSLKQDDFISADSETTRSTIITDKTKSETADVNVLFKLNRNFRKKNRSLTINYQPIYNTFNGSTALNTDFKYYKGQLPDSSLIQDRTQLNYKLEHNASVIYVEPFTKKFKTEVSYYFTHNHNTTNRNTYDFSGTAYDIFNPTLSNNFDNKRIINRAGAKLIYDVKKYRISIGSNFRNVSQENLNVSTGKKLNQQVNNILPNASFVYRFSPASNFNTFYNSYSQQPKLTDMQPVADNTDPNRISIGNPNLVPTFSNKVGAYYYFYKAISDINFYSGSDVSNTNNEISYATVFDSLGKATTQAINVNGNYSGSMYFGGGFPLFNKFLKVYYHVESSHNNNVSYVNSFKNISQSSRIEPSLTLQKEIEKFEIRAQARYEYNVPKTNISSQSLQPYYTYGFEGNVMVKLPKKFIFTTDGVYTNNGNRTPGYNLNYFILNASLAKSFLKTENLIVSINAFDILNQNISNQRFISGNQIVDTKTQVIKRYFLFKVLLKLNSVKGKVDDDEDY